MKKFILLLALCAPAFAGNISVLSTQLSITGQWNENWYLAAGSAQSNQSGSLTQSSAIAPLYGSMTSGPFATTFTDASVSPFHLAMSGISDSYDTQVLGDDGQTYVVSSSATLTAFSSTVFSVDSNSLNLSIDVEGDMLFCEDGYVLTSLLDLTSGDTLLSASNTAAFDVVGVYSYTFDTDPNHTYALNYAGTLNSSDCSISQFTVDYQLDASDAPQFSLFSFEEPVTTPDGFNVLWTLAATLAIVGYVRHASLHQEGSR
jgi:hypothetical protein